MSCSWRFTNLNVAFRAVVGDPSRSLQVYSDVAGSTIVGNRVTDLLREIQYKREGRGTMYFEPLHIQYLPLRNQVVEIIHIQWPKRLVPEETWSSLAKAIPLSRCTSKRHKKERREGNPSQSSCLRHDENDDDDDSDHKRGKGSTQ